MLSYPFHHNNSPAYTSTRVLTFARRSTTSTERYNFALPFALRYPLFLFLLNQPRVPIATPLSAAFASRSPSAWTAMKQSLAPPLTIRIKPFNCRIVFDGSFSPAKLLFKLVPRYVRASTGYFRSFCPITFARV